MLFGRLVQVDETTMTGALHAVSGDRILVIASRRAVGKVLVEQTGRPVAALLTAHSVAKDPAELEPVILSLLDSGCDYFVCFGVASEALHDLIDELVLERASALDRTVMTTWHDDETAAEVAEFFLNTAAAKERSLLVAALEPDDSELADLLVQHSSG
jgi:hypothetical protein